MFDFLASDYPIAAFVVLGVAMVWSRNRSAFSWMLNDAAPWGRRLARGAFAAVGAFVLWATVFDNWRQLLGFLVDEEDRWRSDLYLYGPPPDAVRFVTWSLLALAVLGTGYLFARYADGYFLPLVISVSGIIAFFILNNLRMTFEPAGPLSERGVNFTDPLEALMTFIWFGMFYVVMAILIYSAFAILWGPAAFVLALIYRSTIGRRKIEEPDMFRIIRERSTVGSPSEGGTPRA